jgi:DNA segregation ATPase FtsK/SpoIIIE, S-DNA-T family
MALTGSEADRKRFLPGSIGSGLRRLRMRATGGALILAALICWAALATWSISDPSYNNVTSESPDNILGYWGATIADLAMQSFGLGSVFLVLPLAAWGWHVATGRKPGSVRMRLACWPLAATLMAGTLSTLPAPKTWPLPNGLGGMMGDLAIAGFMALSAILPEVVMSIGAGIILLVCGIWCVFFACAISPAEFVAVWVPDSDAEDEDTYDRRAEDEDEDEDGLEDENEEESRFANRIGAIEHWLLSAPAIVARMLGFRRRAIETEAEDDLYYDDDEDEDDEEPLRRIEYDGAGSEMDEHGRVEPFFEDGPAPVGPSREPDYEREQEPVAAAPAGPVQNFQITPRADTDPGQPKVVTREAGVAESYALPPVRLLKKPATKRSPGQSVSELQENAKLLEEVLADFGVKGEIINVSPGPVVTLYELEPAPGTKSSRVIGLADDIARSMSAISARVAVVPGRNAIGIELPNSQREMVYFREMLEADAFARSEAGLPLVLGKNIGGEAVVADLSRMPHLLIAGTTGSGKSVGINTMILSLLYRYNPDECKFIMIDPKMLELSVYDGIPHLLSPVVTDPKKAVVALKWTVKEMEERYKRMSKIGVRNIDGYNDRVIEAQARGEVITRTVQTGFDKNTGEAIYEEQEMDYDPIPYIVVIVDEMADLMMVAGKEIEGAVQRLAQMARAAGIHLITATQRPSVDVITGTIKANFPTRISFQVTSKIDSRTILGEQGAEQLLGQGDMLYMAGGGRITRVHGPFVSDDEVEKIVRYLKRQGVPQYLEAITAEEDNGPDGVFGEGDEGGEGSDSLYDQAVAVVLRDGKASTSYVQRRLSIGYNRAATLIERMEEEGVISAANHAGKREILVTDGVG